jgi:uncharacterized protein YkwD
VMSGGGTAFKVSKADLRLTNQVCVLQGAGAPTSGASGTGDDFAGPGSLYIDITNKTVYQQTNTISSPTWTQLVSALSPVTLTQTYATADATHANPTSVDVATDAVTQTTPYGFSTQAQGDAVVANLNALRADVLDLKQFVNSITDQLQTKGLAA